MAFNQSCYGLVPREPAGPAFVYFSTVGLVEELRRRSHGSVFSTITRDTLSSIEVPAAADSALMAFEALSAPLLLAIRANVRSNSTLREMREKLLPRLLSGAIRVPDSYDEADVLGVVAEHAGGAV